MLPASLFVLFKSNINLKQIFSFPIPYEVCRSAFLNIASLFKGKKKNKRKKQTTPPHKTSMCISVENTPILLYIYCSNIILVRTEFTNPIFLNFSTLFPSFELQCRHFEKMFQASIDLAVKSSSTFCRVGD